MNNILILPEQLQHVCDIELSNVTYNHDDWCDVFIEKAWIDENNVARELTGEELDYIQNHYQDWVYDKIVDYLY